jgi:hypothetical protein
MSYGLLYIHVLVRILLQPMVSNPALGLVVTIFLVFDPNSTIDLVVFHISCF